MYDKESIGSKKYERMNINLRSIEQQSQQDYFAFASLDIWSMKCEVAHSKNAKQR